MANDTFDLIVLGAGAGGVPAAIRASQLGGRVGIVESRDLGGLCMNRGCIPFGHMMAASAILGSLSLAEEFGIKIGQVHRDFAALLKRQQDLISFMREGLRGLLNKNKIELFQGKGKVVGRGQVQIGDRMLTCKSIILATGGKWDVPEFDGSDLEDVVNGEYFLNIPSLPRRTILYGRSHWTVEIAQFLHRFGSEVVLCTPDKTLLSDEGKTITTRLKKMLKDQGISIKTSAGIAAARKEPDGLHVELEQEEGKETLIADKLAILDRRAAMGDLGLSSLGLDENGEFLKVNERMETAVGGLYGIGDLTGPLSMHYSGLASAGAIVAAENAMGVPAVFNPRTFTRVLFTQPQVACVGLTRREAKDKGYDVVVGSAPYSMNSLGMILSEGDGIVELVAERRYGELLGAHFFGSSATEMAGQAVMAIDMEITLEQLARVSFPHPTLSESFSEAARDALGRPIYLP